MRKPIVMGNWKLNGTKESISTLIEGIQSAANDAQNVEVAVCPPSIFAHQVADLTSNNAIQLGLQDVSIHTTGAYTGEVSADMGKEFGAKYTIVGHSERRQYHHETNELVAEKFVAAQKAELIPVLCIGESLEDRESNNTFVVVKSQLKAVIELAGIEAIGNSVIAYEPMWAIGTGKVATTAQAQEVHSFIRSCLGKQSAEVAKKIQILYGGSVKASNAKDLFEQEDIDGALVGGAALIPEDFSGIIASTK